MRVFITGIAGFIGFHLARALKKRGNFVIGCDNFNDYYDPALKRARVRELGEGVIEMDIREPHLLKQLIVDHEITHFVHLAAQAGVRYCLRHPEAYVENNVHGFVQVLEVLRHYPEIPFTYASSSSVYGLNRKVPFSESDPTETPCSLYAATKKSNELIAQAYHHTYGIPITGLRFFTVYGPWGRPDMAYFLFTDAIVNEKPLQLFNQGQMQRDFTYIDDIIQGTIAAIDLAAPCEIFNLGNNHPEEVLSLIRIIEKETKKKAKIELAPALPGEVELTYADIEKSRHKLGFFPTTSLADGMEKFIAWHQTYTAKPAANIL